MGNKKNRNVPSMSVEPPLMAFETPAVMHRHHFTVGRVTKKGNHKDVIGVRVESEQKDWFELSIEPSSDAYKMMAKAISKGQAIKVDVSHVS